jgi:hypothetical protein
MNHAVESFEGELRQLRERVVKLEKIFAHATADKTGLFFICGESGEKDNMGLPKMIMVCPQIGADGFAIYTKTTDYSAPGY